MLPISARRRVSLTGLLGVVLAALALALLPAPAAHAAERTVSGGRMDWGVRSSFLTYITGPVAQGSWGLSGGAGTVGNSQFRFHSATGGYDPATGSVSAAYTGGVRFQGHFDEQGVPELDLTISNPSVRVNGTSGTLYADIRSKARGSGQVNEVSGVALASLDLSGVDLRGGSRISVTGAPATLTTDGATAFAGYYAAGDPLDPVTFTADTLDPAPDPAEPTPDPAPDDAAREQDEEDAEGEDEDGGDAGEAPDTAEITDAALDWGVRRTYREFVTGDIADGGWELADGAQDGGALFRFPDGTGELDAEAGLLTAAFTGSVHFAGNDLDLLVDAVRVEVADGSGTMTADVTTAAGTAEDQPLVTFEVPELAVEDGLFHLSEAPAELTAEGAEAFGGLYSEGTVMDPLTLAVAVSDDAELPPLPDLGSEPVEEAEPEPTPEPEPLTAESTADDSSSPVPLPAAAAIALLALAGAGYLVRRRTTGARRATTPPEDTDKETTER